MMAARGVGSSGPTDSIAPPPMRLHGGWRPGAGGEPGRFAVWAEASYATVPDGPAPAGKRPRQHPRQVSLEALADALTAMGLPGVSGRGAALPASKVALRLPVVDGTPLPAVETPPLTDLQRHRPRRRAPYVVQVLNIELAPTVEVMGASPLPLPDDVELGPDMAYWARACRLVLYLLARQRFAPAMTGGGDGARASWAPVIDDPRDCERLSALIESMPRGCRAFASEGDPEPSAKAIIEDFMGTATDACVRLWLSEGPVEAPLKDAGLPLSRWWAALQRPDAGLGISQAQAEQLELTLQAWLRPLNWSRTVTPLRTCVRLEEPVPPPGIASGHAWTPAAEERCWRLSYLLQPMDDPSLLVRAEEVWGLVEGPGLELLRKRTARPHEQLLSDLARISRISPAVEASLRGRAPSGAALTTGEAFAFLTEAAPLLEECGVGVLVPSWWKSPSARVGVRVRVGGAKEFGKGTGYFSKDRLAVFDWRLAVGDTPLTEDELAALSASKGELVHLRGMWVSVDPGRLAATAERWRRQKGEAGLLEVLQWSEGLDRAGGALPVLGVDAEGDVAELLRRLKSPGAIAPVALPAGFSGALRPYQERGVAWLNFLRSFGLGMCLADDMGLGKTVQLLALLSHISEREGDGPPTLLVCPTSVVGNWAREAARFTPELRVVVHHGPDRPRGDAFREAIEQADVVVTSYPLVTRDHADMSGLGWTGLVLDEAQAVKNPGSKQSQSCRKLRSGWRVALTGTPVENRLRDLWSIFSILNPGYLGTLDEFQETFATPIEDHHDKEATAMLQGLVRPFLLRRLKTDPGIAPELPPKIQTRETCNLTKEQASLYEALVDRMIAELEDADRQVVRAPTAAAAQQARFRRSSIVLTTLLRLKQVCNHPSQMLGDGSPLHGRSGKLSRLVELLEEMAASGESALVFTQFASLAQRLQPYLAERLGVEVLLLHGGTPRPERERLIARFQSGGAPRVFLLSLKAGGVGVNLTVASQVVHFDRWWNPAVEDQATDRAHRIGQGRRVQVHKLVTAGTIEESIDALLEEKRGLAASIVGAGEEWLTAMTTAQLRQLVRLRHAVVEG